MKSKYNEYEIEKQINLNIEKTKQIINYRNKQIFKGFVYKGYEECSFNDFYSNGNEYILKYGGIINGMLRKNPELLRDVSEDIEAKISAINDKVKILLNSNENHNGTYNIFYQAANYCVVVCSDEVYKFKNLMKEETLFSILDEFHVMTNTKDTNFKEQKLKELLEVANRKNTVNERLLASTSNLKRNAYYSLRKLEMFIEKNDDKSETEIKNHFTKCINEEMSVLNNLSLFNTKIYTKEVSNNYKRFSI